MILLHILSKAICWDKLRSDTLYKGRGHKWVCSHSLKILPHLFKQYTNYSIYNTYVFFYWDWFAGSLQRTIRLWLLEGFCCRETKHSFRKINTNPSYISRGIKTRPLSSAISGFEYIFVVYLQSFTGQSNPVKGQMLNIHESSSFVRHYINFRSTEID